jgi:HEAT repeats
VAALERLLTGGDRTTVAATIHDAPDPARRTAACVVTACALMDAERHAEAVILLSEQPDDAAPVDWAWVQVQLARARAEIGKVAAARQDAAAALRHLVGDPDDVTAAAIGAAAAQLLFQTAQWGEKQLDEVITATDTAVSWWRTQMLSSAFTAAADRDFRQWADERATRTFGDTVNNQLFAALVSADLTGEQGTWRTIGSLLARDTLVVQHAAGDTGRQADALDELRRSGDARSLKLAASRLWAVGPLGPLADVARRIQAGSWTHTTARANLTLWQEAGDLLDEAAASAAARYCLAVAADASAFVARTTPSFDVIPSTLDALGGVVPAADDALHRDLAAFVTSLPPVTDEFTARSLARVGAGLRATALAAAADRAAWREAAAAQPNRRLAAAMLAKLADDDKAARELLLDRIAEGDNDALAALGPLDQLDAARVGRLTADDAQLLDTMITEAHRGAHAVRTRDPAYRLAVVGSFFPDATPWDALLRFLRDDRVPSQRKRRACLALAAHASRLPEPVRSALRDLVPQLKASDQAIDLFGLPFGGAALLLAAGVGALDGQALTSSLATLLTGSRQERRDTAMLIGRLGRRDLTSALVVLLGDPFPDVRAEAARTLAMGVASRGTDVDPLAVAGLRRALADPGARTPLAIADGVAAAEMPSDQARELIAPLLDHPSALVREATRALHSR